MLEDQDIKKIIDAQKGFSEEIVSIKETMATKDDIKELKVMFNDL